MLGGMGKKRNWTDKMERIINKKNEGNEEGFQCTGGTRI